MIKQKSYIWPAHYQYRRNKRDRGKIENDHSYAMKKNQWPDNGQATFKNKLQGIEREMEDRFKH